MNTEKSIKAAQPPPVIPPATRQALQREGRTSSAPGLEIHVEGEGMRQSIQEQEKDQLQPQPQPQNDLPGSLPGNSRKEVSFRVPLNQSQPQQSDDNDTNSRSIPQEIKAPSKSEPTEPIIHAQTYTSTVVASKSAKAQTEDNGELLPEPLQPFRSFSHLDSSEDSTPRLSQDGNIIYSAHHVQGPPGHLPAKVMHEIGSLREVEDKHVSDAYLIESDNENEQGSSFEDPNNQNNRRNTSAEMSRFNISRLEEVSFLHRLNEPVVIDLDEPIEAPEGVELVPVGSRAQNKVLRLFARMMKKPSQDLMPAGRTRRAAPDELISPPPEPAHTPNSQPSSSGASGTNAGTGWETGQTIPPVSSIPLAPPPPSLAMSSLNQTSPGTPTRNLHNRAYGRVNSDPHGYSPGGAGAGGGAGIVSARPPIVTAPGKISHDVLSQSTNHMPTGRVRSISRDEGASLASLSQDEIASSASLASSTTSFHTLGSHHFPVREVKSGRLEYSSNAESPASDTKNIELRKLSNASPSPGQEKKRYGRKVDDGVGGIVMADSHYTGKRSSGSPAMAPGGAGSGWGSNSSQAAGPHVGGIHIGGGAGGGLGQEMPSRPRKRLIHQIIVRDLSEIEHVHKLGQGIQGVVYEAIHKPTGFRMAVKVENADKEGVRKDLRREIRVQCALNHKNIVKFYGSMHGDDGKTMHTMLQLMDGGSLQFASEILNGIDEPALSHITAMCLEGLRFMHNLGIMHRDIKTQNILIGLKERVVKLTDFGHAVKNTMGKTFAGTIEYMSPERLNNQSYTYAADIWSLGLCVVECFMGKHPFPSRPEYWEYIESARPGDVLFANFERKASEELCHFVNQCTKVIPSERPKAEFLLFHPFIRKYKNDEEPMKAFIKKLTEKIRERELLFQKTMKGEVAKTMDAER
mmetsp:Transcript_12569/g.21452  ORF Transcript_12569/g.21452 Transcript_12569/m.21452 type:complete len:914 (-) Transcript_12569:152-2893(-)|eukprot:CAMPEP_0184701394 /NCGR_PEP_ID=MMETSP0313-20130426/19699_1 /TAXON_ID=2792 /ORGANISM="Porphyridium aerugineum, Strain SAG 1380-2" /LENGTH=913 /DNA_ID=CAMNT_0027161437 /DNA_START=438 /DNA_END=3179 /DNA_ORIENTATION=-